MKTTKTADGLTKMFSELDENMKEAINKRLASKKPIEQQLNTNKFNYSHSIISD